MALRCIRYHLSRSHNWLMQRLSRRRSWECRPHLVGWKWQLIFCNWCVTAKLNSYKLIDVRPIDIFESEMYLKLAMVRLRWSETTKLSKSSGRSNLGDESWYGVSFQINILKTDKVPEHIVISKSYMRVGKPKFIKIPDVFCNITL